MFTCSTCGELHDLENISFGADRPAQWNVLTDEEKQSSELTSDQCVIETGSETSFFVRGCLDIPIKGATSAFTWGVWVSLSEQSFLEMSEHWDDPARVNLGPYFGWLCTAIPAYPDTMFLKTNVRQRAVGVRPTVELEPTDHPLAVHQWEGIEPAELQAMVQQLLHG